jgi:hypothetical protein
MKNKETAIELLRAIANWMEVSRFDYDELGLTQVLNEVKTTYIKYLKEKTK